MGAGAGTEVGAGGAGVLQATSAMTATARSVRLIATVIVTKLGGSVAEPTAGGPCIGNPACGQIPPRKVRHILIVDDDPAIRQVVADILEMSDYGVREAANGAEALDEVRSWPPAMVLLDLMMPVMDGWEFLRRCRSDQVCEGVPVAVMSAARDAGAISDELGGERVLAQAVRA